MKAVVKTCTGAISLDHLDFRFFMFGSYSRNQDKFTVSLISWQKLIFLVFEEAVRIQSLCKFSWSFGLQSWFTGSILWWFSFFRKQSSLPSIKAGVRICACAIALDRLDLKIVYVWLTYLVKIRMNLLSVLFWEGSLSSYFLRKLFKFGAYTNSLDHLDCSLAVFHNSLFQEGNFLFPSKKAGVGTCSCAIYLDHLDFLWLIFGSHI